jgi:phosphoglycolate phosphatase
MSEHRSVTSAPVFGVDAVAFDLDGTLLDTVHDLAAAVNLLLAELGHPPLHTVTVRDLVGKGMASLVRKAMLRARGRAPDDAELAVLLPRYQAHYENVLGHETEAFPGLLEMLVRLKAEGFRLAVVTNKATRFVRPHLDKAGILGYFDAIVGGDDAHAKKPDPAPIVMAAQRLGVPVTRMLMVGDSVNDAQAARAAGCPVVLLPHGYNEGEPVHGLDCDGIVPSLAAVADCVRRAGGPVVAA